MRSNRTAIIWAAVASIGVWAILAAAASPLLQWRDPVYIAAGFAGLLAFVLMSFQPLLMIRTLYHPIHARRIHAWIGIALLGAVIVHVGGLWITSPPDVIDVLLFRSPTPFAIWGAVAMWAILLAALLALVKKRISVSAWRFGHTVFVTIAVVGTVAHAWLIEGTMGLTSKAVISVATLALVTFAIWHRKSWKLFLHCVPLCPKDH